MEIENTLMSFDQDEQRIANCKLKVCSVTPKLGHDYPTRIKLIIGDSYCIVNGEELVKAVGNSLSSRRNCDL